MILKISTLNFINRIYSCFEQINPISKTILWKCNLVEFESILCVNLNIRITSICYMNCDGMRLQIWNVANALSERFSRKFEIYFFKYIFVDAFHRVFQDTFQIDGKNMLEKIWIGSYYLYNKRNSVCYVEPRPSNADQPIDGACLTFDLAPQKPYSMQAYSVQLWKQMSLRKRPKYSASDSNLNKHSLSLC